MFEYLVTKIKVKTFAVSATETFVGSAFTSWNLFAKNVVRYRLEVNVDNKKNYGKHTM